MMPVPPTELVGNQDGKDANGNNQQLGFNQMPPEEEENFGELIFPGCQEGTFIWNVTLFQIAIYFRRCLVDWFVTVR